MYYNINEKILLRKLPKNLLKEDGSLFIDFYLSDPTVLSDYGYYAIRNDNKEPPTPNSIENVSLRQIIVEKPYADIIRTWKDPTMNIETIQNPEIKE